MINTELIEFRFNRHCIVYELFYISIFLNIILCYYIHITKYIYHAEMLTEILNSNVFLLYNDFKLYFTKVWNWVLTLFLNLNL